MIREQRINARPKAIRLSFSIPIHRNDSASPTKDDTMDFTKTLRTIGNTLEVKRLMNGVRNIEPNDFLNRVGLERRRSTMDAVLPALGFFAAGAAIGAGLAILFTPSTGSEVRGKIAKAATDAKDKVEGLLANNEEETEEESSTETSSRSRNGRRAHNHVNAL